MKHLIIVMSGSMVFMCIDFHCMSDDQQKAALRSPSSGTLRRGSLLARLSKMQNGDELLRDAVRIKDFERQIEAIDQRHQRIVSRFHLSKIAGAVSGGVMTLLFFLVGFCLTFAPQCAQG